MTKKKRTTMKQARRVGDKIGVDWDRFDLEQFRAGMDVELEHGAHDLQTDVTGDEPILTGKIALTHMKEFPDYYERLGSMEKEAEREWARRRRANLLMWLLALRGIARGVLGGWLARRQYLKEAPQAWYQRRFFSEYRLTATWLAPVALITGLLLSTIFFYRRRYRKAKTQEENKAVFRRYVEEVGNEGNLELAEEIFDRYQAHQEVVGAEQMGAGIAQVMSRAGLQVYLSDVKEDIINKSLKTIEKNFSRSVQKERMKQEEMDEAMARIETGTEYADDADLAIEAVVETLAVKAEVFKDLDERLGESAILASNTSSISITELAARTSRPERFVGMHFFYPVPAMKLVEIIRGLETSNETYDAIHELTGRIGKTPAEAQDFPGFISTASWCP